MGRKSNKQKYFDRSCKAEKGACVLCFKGVENESVAGKLYGSQGISAHYFCILFACGLVQNGKSVREGIKGFLVDDIVREAKRGRFLRCLYCKKVGATIGCCLGQCREVFHFPCGVENGVINQFFGSFFSYCRKHKPVQSVPDTPVDCSICWSSPSLPSSDTHLKSPCCSSSWFHRSCLQNYAVSAGYFFKCPLCNDKKLFRQEMLKYGIYIPDQDASWELESNAYQELLVRPQCGAEHCKCPNGRDFNKEGTKWRLMFCASCGSLARHQGCEKVSRQHKWVCSDCKQMEEDLQKRKQMEEFKKYSLRYKLKELSVVLVDANQEISSKRDGPIPSTSKTFTVNQINDDGNNSSKQPTLIKTEVQISDDDYQSQLIDTTYISGDEFPDPLPSTLLKFDETSSLGKQTSKGAPPIDLMTQNPHLSEQLIESFTEIKKECSWSVFEDDKNSSETNKNDYICSSYLGSDCENTNCRTRNPNIAHQLNKRLFSEPANSSGKENHHPFQLKHELREDAAVAPETQGTFVSTSDNIAKDVSTSSPQVKKLKLVRNVHQSQITQYLKNCKDNQEGHKCNHLNETKRILKKYGKKTKKFSQEDLLKQGLRTLDDMINPL